MDLDPTLWDISKHETYMNTAEFSFTCKEAQRWKRRCSFPSTCHAEGQERPCSTQPQSGRARGFPGTQPFPESSRAQLQAEHDPRGRRGQPKAGDHSKEPGFRSSWMGRGNCQEEQGAKTPSLVERKWKGLRWQLSSDGEPVKHRHRLSGETRESASLEIFRTQLD